MSWGLFYLREKLWDHGWPKAPKAAPTLQFVRKARYVLLIEIFWLATIS
ncbi:TPA: hypothetical protein GRI80_02820 [Vibrio parahaemolyticus]|uniref:Uncharacterized protein n=1 Tax=Vibrio parahaemolyticus TaxID=670 RepID=A0A2R9VJU7_VIBPH|nr:hypothetical protein BGM07_025260 [Vibrio parahaemolyticus]AWA87956.1 hypothetical protein BSG32_02390 [Vibrio parahaemolyticus]AWG80200.1 hypothetical protein C9I78_16005 [Vibrio parahaemolyticus]AWJ79830.1 hypothetical protein C7Y67_16120 [Vibrio parahaemolyticus]AYO05926.1 hypothetical protein D0871_17205 [Vibrio parahaemolyticus]